MSAFVSVATNVAENSARRCVSLTKSLLILYLTDGTQKCRNDKIQRGKVLSRDLFGESLPQKKLETFPNNIRHVGNYMYNLNVKAKK